MRQSGAADRGADRFRNGSAIFSALTRQQHREFLAPITVSHTFFPHDSSKAFPDILHHHVAGVMTVFIVEPLEVVDVDHQAGKWLRRMIAGVALQCLVKMPAIEQSGKGIADRQ